MITIEQAKALKPGDIVHLLKACKQSGNGDLYLETLTVPAKWKVTGKVKTWKRSPDRISVPIKHGLYSYAHLTEDNLELFELVDN